MIFSVRTVNILNYLFLIDYPKRFSESNYGIRHMTAVLESWRNLVYLYLILEPGFDLLPSFGSGTGLLVPFFKKQSKSEERIDIGTLKKGACIESNSDLNFLNLILVLSRTGLKLNSGCLIFSFYANFLIPETEEAPGLDSFFFTRK